MLKAPASRTATVIACLVVAACHGSSNNGLDRSGLGPDGATPLPDAAGLMFETGGAPGAGGATSSSGAATAAGGALAANGGSIGAGGGSGAGGSRRELTDAAAVTPTDAGADAATACSTDGDCAAPTRFCDVSLGRCVQCLSTNNCPTAETCDLTDHVCKFACTTSADCSDPHPYCDTKRKECVECLSDTNCASGNKNVCNSATRSCVECAANSDCSCLLLGQAPCCTSSNTCMCGLLVCL